MSSAEFAALHFVCLGCLVGGFHLGCLAGLTGPFAGIFTFREAVISISSRLIDIDKYLKKRGDEGCPGCNTREESKPERKGVTTKWECSRTNLTDSHRFRILPKSKSGKSGDLEISC